MHKSTDKGERNISVNVSLSDRGVLLFLVEMIAGKRNSDTDIFFSSSNYYGTTSIELPASGNTILSHNKRIDKITFTRRFVFTCLNENGNFVFKWLTSLN